jgi:hypothetical protein
VALQAGLKGDERQSMGFLDKMFPGRRPATASRPAPVAPGEAEHSALDASQFPHSQRPPSQFSPSQAAPASPHAIRKDLLRLVLRELDRRRGAAGDPARP